MSLKLVKDVVFYTEKFVVLVTHLVCSLLEKSCQTGNDSPVCPFEYGGMPEKICKGELTFTLMGLLYT